MTAAEFFAEKARVVNNSGSELTRVGTLRDLIKTGHECVADPKTKNHIWNGDYGKYVFVTDKSGKGLIIGFGSKTNIDSTIMDLVDLPIYKGVSTIEGEGFGKEFIVFGKEASNSNFNLDALLALEATVAAPALQGQPA